MKKLVFVLLGVLAMALLTACGSKSIDEIEGSTYECSRFSAKCPSGWINVPVKELNSEKISQDHLRFSRMDVEEGEEPGNRVYSNAYVDVAYYAASSQLDDKAREKLKSALKNVEDAELVVKDKKWKGFLGEVTSGRQEVHLWLDGQPEWQIDISLYDVDGNLELEDVEIQAILDSLQKK